MIGYGISFELKYGMTIFQCKFKKKYLSGVKRAMHYIVNIYDKNIVIVKSM